MPDFWSVPIANSILPGSVNDQIAKGVDLSWVGKLLDSYQKGKDYQYTDRNRDVFQNGLPRDANGNIDFSQAADQLAKAGGSGQVSSITSLLQTQLQRDAMKQLGGVDSQPSTSAVPPSASPAIPNNVPPAVKPTGQPVSSADIPAGPKMAPGQNLTGPDTTISRVDYGPVQYTGSTGALTPRTVAQRLNVDPEVIAGRLGIGIDQRIDPNDPNARMQIAQLARGQAPQAQAPQIAAPQLPQAPQISQAMPPQIQPNMSESVAQNYENRARAAFKQGAAISFVNPQAGALLKALGEGLMKQAEIIRGQLAKNAELTPEQKNAQSSGQPNPLALEREQKVQAGNIASGQKEYEGIQAQSTQFQRDLKPYLEVSRSIINDPRFYSGFGGQLSLDFNRVKAALGDRNAAMLQEALQKVTASSVLSQINNQRAQLQEAGGNSSRIFSQQVSLVEKAAPALANTTAGNRFLVEVSTRMGELAGKVAQMARNYRAQHGYLDAGFDQKLSDYMNKKPLFTEQEMTHPEILGAPTVPPQLAGNKNGIMQWATQLGLKSGDAIRFPNGQVKAVP